MNNKFRFAVRKFPPFESAMQKIWKAYCAYSGCTLEAEFVAMDLPELHQSIIDDEGLKSGTWDVAHIVTDWLLEAHDSGALENLNTRMERHPPEDYPAGWSSSLLKMQNFNQAVVGLPFHDGPECLIYRKDLFENEEEKAAFRQRHGRGLRVPETWEDFLEVAEFFHRPGQNLYGTVAAAYPDGHNTVFDFCLQLWTRGGKLLADNNEINLETDEALQALQFYSEWLNNQEAIHPDSHQYESVAAGAAFSRGEAAMMINWFGFAAVNEVTDSAVKGKVDVAPVPSKEGKHPASLNVYWLYAIGSGSVHKEVAYDFISFASNRQNDKLLTLEGGIGCRKSTWKDKEINGLIPYYHKLEELHEHAKTLPQKPNWSAIAKVIDEMVTRAIQSKGKNLETWLKEAQIKLEAKS